MKFTCSFPRYSTRIVHYTVKLQCSDDRTLDITLKLMQLVTSWCTSICSATCCCKVWSCTCETRSHARANWPRGL